MEVDPSRLLMGLEVESFVQREVEDAPVEIVEFLARLLEGDNWLYPLPNMACHKQLKISSKFSASCSDQQTIKEK